MKKLAVVTATRAEYGLLSPVIKELRKHEKDDFVIELIVTGTHLSEKFGYTIDEIDDRIDHKVFIPVDSKTEIDISRNQANALEQFTELFVKQRYEAVMLLGDRYEILAVAIAAGNTRTPIFHLCGGDTTEGAIDEWIRHSITKMSYLHFVTNEVSMKRVIQMGENPSRVFNYGSTSIDNILSNANMSKKEALSSIGMTECRYAVCTYHPVTMDGECIDRKVQAFLDAIRLFPEIQFIVTKSNADLGGEKINELLDYASSEIENLHVFASLGVKRYLSLMKYSEFVLGNSSSGIIETPAFHIPTINIGDRQKGRLQADSIINCSEEKKSICEAIELAISPDYQEKCRNAKCLYGNGHAARNIAERCLYYMDEEIINLKKEFYDIS